MRKTSERETNWVLNIVLITLFALSVLYMALYWWPHSQGRSSVFDGYEPAARAFLEKLGFAPKTEVSGQVAGEKQKSPPVDPNVIRNAILGSAEWVNADELDDVQTSGRAATVLVRARMTDDEALSATRDIITIVFEEVGNLTQIRVITRVKARSAAKAGRVVDSVRTDIMMTRATYERLNWSSVKPRQLPKVADSAKVYF